MTRASTLLLALLTMNVLLGALCLVVARGERKSAALRLWGTGLLVYAAGILLTIAGFVPFDLRKIVGNGLIAWAPVLCVQGALTHTRYRMDRRLVLAGLAVSIAPIVYNHVVGPYRVLVDMVAPAPIANVVFLFAAFALLRDPPADARAAGRFVAATFAASVLVWTVRLLTIGLQIGGTNDRERGDLAIALFSIAQMVAAVGTTLGLLWIEVRRMQAALQRLADTDALTGLPNRRATLGRFRDEAARAARRKESFGMLVLDIDHFKRVNDTLGHAAGDAVLKHVASVLAASVRADEVAGRVGGEEFVLLLAGGAPGGPMAAAERLRETIASSPASGDSALLAVTVSGGLALYPADGADWDRLFSAADERLYRAKQGGRNRIEGPPEG